ncbi:hypothetical protein BD289DRAFT_186443 [Coniella lustricola]|uniref:Uncharacterized protein n=1 Tax=Coniella lustricola TaxID=2025994 RepID=A0A2T3AD46_9PEZI|nr:hypothetical protein BD289DRAFT_186443 [Coniella lustricola]
MSGSSPELGLVVSRTVQALLQSQNQPCSVSPSSSFLSLPTEIRLKIYALLFDDLVTTNLTDNLFATFLVADITYNTTPSHKQVCQWNAQGGCNRMVITTWMCREHRDAMQTLLDARRSLLQPKLLRFFGLSRFELALIQHPRFKAAVERAAVAASNDSSSHLSGTSAGSGSGLTSLLTTNRLVAAEALEVLCQRTEFVLSITGRADMIAVGGDMDTDLRLPEGYAQITHNKHVSGVSVPSHLLIATHVKMNLVPYQGVLLYDTDRRGPISIPVVTAATTSPTSGPSAAEADDDAVNISTRLFTRLEAVLDALESNCKLQSLSVFIHHSCLSLHSGTGASPDTVLQILVRLQARLGARIHKDICTVKIFLGDISGDIVCDDTVMAVADGVNGKFIGRDYKALKPNRMHYKSTNATRRLWRT